MGCYQSQIGMTLYLNLQIELNISNALLLVVAFRVLSDSWNSLLPYSVSDLTVEMTSGHQHSR